MVPVECRNRETLIPIIQKFIQPGTIIISDCWKAYDVLNKLDYEHLKVNHSIEFVNEEGDHTNKIEGHWRQAKAKLPSFGTNKKLFESPLGEFMWRYANKENDRFIEFLKSVSEIYKFE